MTAADIGLVVSLLLVGALAGNEAGTLAVIHPSLDRLPYRTGRPAAQAVVAGYGRVMPVVMPVTVAVTFITGAGLDGPRRLMVVSAGGLLVAMLVVTFVGLMPLNRRQLEAEDDTPESEWNGWRARWWRLHAVRVVLDVAALVLVAIAAVSR